MAFRNAFILLSLSVIIFSNESNDLTASNSTINPNSDNYSTNISWKNKSSNKKINKKKNKD